MKKNVFLFKEFFVSVPSKEHLSKSIFEQYEIKIDEYTTVIYSRFHIFGEASRYK